MAWFESTPLPGLDEKLTFGLPRAKRGATRSAGRHRTAPAWLGYQLADDGRGLRQRPWDGRRRHRPCCGGPGGSFVAVRGAVWRSDRTLPRHGRTTLGGVWLDLAVILMHRSLEPPCGWYGYLPTEPGLWSISPASSSKNSAKNSRQTAQFTLGLTNEWTVRLNRFIFRRSRP